MGEMNMKQRICLLLAALLLCATGLMIPAGASEINGETWSTAPSAASTEETRDPAHSWACRGDRGHAAFSGTCG